MKRRGRGSSPRPRLVRPLGASVLRSTQLVSDAVELLYTRFLDGVQIPLLGHHQRVAQPRRDAVDLAARCADHIGCEGVTRVVEDVLSQSETLANRRPEVVREVVPVPGAASGCEEQARRPPFLAVLRFALFDLLDKGWSEVAVQADGHTPRLPHASALVLGAD